MKRLFVILVIFAAVAVPVTGALALGDNGPVSQRKADPNRAQDSQAAEQASALAKQIYKQIVSESKVPGDLCAIAVIPGPAGSFNIRLGVFNATAGNTLDHLIEDSFFALGGSSLLHESVFDTAPPPGGSLTVEYPAAGGGKGPVVLSFTDFGPLESASYNTDPDTYDDPAFGSTVLDMSDTRLEGVFSNGLRCAGRLTFSFDLNASIALLTQTSP